MRAVVAKESTTSDIACAIVSYTVACSMMSLPPAAIGRAKGLGQPSRGATKRNSVMPQFFIARALAPIFSPICGRNKITIGGCVNKSII